MDLVRLLDLDLGVVKVDLIPLSLMELPIEVALIRFFCIDSSIDWGALGGVLNTVNELEISKELLLRCSFAPAFSRAIALETGLVVLATRGLMHRVTVAI